jgi:hypothetical protein
VHDRELLARFEACTLPASLFDHRAHVRVAWIYLRELPLLAALARFRESLRRDAASLGASTQYHETITFAFLFLIHERMQREPFETFDAFAAANDDLFGNLLGRYYSKETLASELARTTFLLPDCATYEILR